jgi:hypothetical protein
MMKIPGRSRRRQNKALNRRPLTVLFLAVCASFIFSPVPNSRSESENWSPFESSEAEVKSVSPLERFLATKDAASMSAGTLATLKSVFAVKNFFEWYPIYEKDRENPSGDKIVSEALTSMAHEMERENLPWTITESLDLMAFRWKAEDLRADGRVNYRVSWLFHATDKIKLEPNQTLRLILQGRVQRQHRHLLNQQSERDVGVFECTYTIEPPPNEWLPGTYHLVTNRYSTAPIPYHMHTFFIMKENDKFKRPWGERVILEWLIDLGDFN